MSKRRESASASRWREIVREHADSGLSVAAYCRRARLPQSSFYAWRRKLRDVEPPARRGSRSAFAEVRLTPEADRVAGSGSVDDHGVLELRLPRGRCVIVHPGFDRQTLRDLVATLEACEPTAGTSHATAVNVMRKCGPEREAGV